MNEHMIRRTIMVFPEFDNMDIINEIRDKYDPLARHVRPHISCVFTFESNLNYEEVKKHLENVLKDFKEFKLEMQGFIKIDNEFGKYIFARITKGNEEIRKLSKCLYSGTLKSYKPSWLTDESFLPHMTVGEYFDSSEELDKAYEDIKDIDDVFSTVVKKVSVEIVDENEDSIIEIEKKLN